MASTSIARIGQAKTFWRILKSVSLSEIERDAARPISFAVVGAATERASVIAHLYEGASDATAADRAVESFANTSEETGFPQDPGAFDIAIDAGGGRVDPPPGAHIVSVAEIGDWERVVERLLDLRPDLLLAMARRFPGLRTAVCARIISETATANAQLAMLNALPGVIPGLGVLLPTSLLGDIVLLTKNQAIMLLRLAAAHDLPLDLRARMQDLAPLLGNAFGWRAVARELVAVVPGGVGVAARGAIAYSGTYTLGHAVHRLYAYGQRPTRAQLAALYREARGHARGIVGGLAKAIGDRRPKRKALPPAE